MKAVEFGQKFICFNCLPVLDVCVERTDIGFETKVCRKPTFTGQYLRWEFCSPLKRKISLISLHWCIAIKEIKKILHSTSDIRDSDIRNFRL